MINSVSYVSNPSADVQVSDSDDFCNIPLYVPPPAAITAKRVLLKPNWGYPDAPPVTVRVAVVRAVIEGIRRAAPDSEILIVEGVCSKLSADQILHRLGAEILLTDSVRFLDADTLSCKEYPNRSPHPQRFLTMLAPRLLDEVDCRISIGGFKRTILKEKVLMSCAIKNLYGLFPRSAYHARSVNSRGMLHRPDVQRVIADVYHTIGVLFDGAVVDATEKFISRDWEPDKGTAHPFGKILWGNNLLAVDRRACELSGEGLPAYLEWIDAALSDQSSTS